MVTFDENGYLATIVVDAKKFTKLAHEVVSLRSELEKLSYFIEPHARGVLGRFMTADEMIAELVSRTASSDDELDALQAVVGCLEREKELLVAVVIQTGYLHRKFQGMTKGMKDALKAAINGGALEE